MSTITLSAPIRKTPSTAMDAIVLLRVDHGTVRGLFTFYEKTDSSKSRKSLVTEICTELTVHAQVEEEIFYPAVKATLHDRLLLPEATIEHEGINKLIAQLEGFEPDGEMYDARVKVLFEYVEHHVREEENEIFPRARASSLDLVKLGARMKTRKTELLAARPKDSEHEKSLAEKEPVHEHVAERGKPDWRHGARSGQTPGQLGGDQGYQR